MPRCSRRSNDRHCLRWWRAALRNGMLTDTAKLWWGRFLLVFLGIPFAIGLMLLDAVCAAWDELRQDLKDSRSAFVDHWREP